MGEHWTRCQPSLFNCAQWFSIRHWIPYRNTRLLILMTKKRLLLTPFLFATASTPLGLILRPPAVSCNGYYTPGPNTGLLAQGTLPILSDPHCVLPSLLLSPLGQQTRGILSLSLSINSCRSACGVGSPCEAIYKMALSIYGLCGCKAVLKSRSRWSRNYFEDPELEPKLSV